MYVVIVTGYEGIEAVMWAGADEQEARQQVTRIRERMVAIGKMPTKKRDRQPYPWYALDPYTPDHVCVMRAGDECFVCCCGDLDVSPSQPMYR